MRRSGVVHAAVVLLAAAVAAPAAAQTSVVTDPRGDVRHVPAGTGWSDIVHVRTTHGLSNVRVRVTPDRATSAADFVYAWIDTDGRDPGPEYRVVTNPGEGHAVFLARVDGWGRRGATEVPCRGLAATGSFATLTTVPRACLGSPAAVRVSVAYEIYVHDRPFRRNDWAPGRQRFDRWLVSGPVSR